MAGSASAGRLRLADLDFEIAHATLSGWMTDPYWVATWGGPGDRVALGWSIDVTAREREVAGQCWAPRLEVAIDASPARWPELAGVERAWAEPHGNLYVFGHEPLRESRLRIGALDGARFELRWRGRCDVLWDERYGGDLAFEVDASLAFVGIAVHGSERDTDADFDARLAAAIDPTGLVRRPTERDAARYESGVAMATARWRPR
jgi:hypothetical protein